MNKKIFIAGVLFLFFVAVLAGIVFVLKKEKQAEIQQRKVESGKDIAGNEELIRVFKENQESQSFEKIDISDWKKYKNDYYGYQISYPDDWEISIDDNREKGTVDGITLHIAKDCDSKELRNCSNEVEITSHKPTGMPIVAKRAEGGKLSVIVSEAFRDVFTLKEGETRESLQYNKKSSCYIYDGAVLCGFGFINDPIYLSEETIYLIDIKDSTKERKYLKTEQAIIDSLKVIKKLN